MSRGRPKAELRLSSDQPAQLESIANSRSLPHALVRRVEIVLASASGEPDSAIANRMRLTKVTVGKWRKR